MPHINEKYDFAVSVFIVHNGRVLFANHPKYDRWLPLGGHVELDEDPEETLFREIAEETGMEVEVLSSKLNIDDPSTKHIFQPNYVDVHEANPPHKHVAFIYFVRAKDDKFTMSDEHLDLQWLTHEDIQSPEYKLSPSLRFYAAEALKAEAAHGKPPKVD
jgi:ADP-ribose pyrophosphatase YjhB (NUDIX family)